MEGGTEIILVENPDSLIELPEELYNYDKWKNISNYYRLYANDTLAFKQITLIYSAWNQLISSVFRIKGRNYFLVHTWKDYTWNTNLMRFTAADSLDPIIAHDKILSGLPASHGEKTRKINNQTVIDYTLFADSSDESANELVTTFIINDSTLIRIDW